MKALIETRGLGRWYGQVVALSDLTMQIGPGITGLLGPNGAGKTTLLRLLVGQLRASRGEVLILGENVYGNRPLLRQIGYAPEHEGSYENLTALETCTALTQLHGFSEVEATARARAMLEQMDLADAMNRRVSEFSKGMRQRCKLAHAFAHDPKVVLLDEPLTGCDPLARVKILAVIRERAEKGCCVLVSSHVLHEIEALTSQIVLIHKGRLLAEGDVQGVRALIDRHPHRIRVSVTATPRKLAEVLIAMPAVKTVHVEENRVSLETADPDTLYSAIPKVARELGVEITALTSPDNNLAAVFHYLTKDSGLAADIVTEGGGW